MSSQSISIERRDGVALITIDDGKVNVLTPDVVSSLREAFDSAFGDASVQAIVLSGRPGTFSAGFDLKTLASGAEPAMRLVAAGADLIRGIYGGPKPVVAACSGHAIAAGALLLLASDLRIGASGKSRIGLIEVRRGMDLPPWASALARERLGRREFVRATTLAHTYSPDEAVAAGFLDRVVESAGVLGGAIAAANDLKELDPRSYVRTVEITRGATLHRMGASILHVPRGLELQ